MTFKKSRQVAAIELKTMHPLCDNSDDTRALFQVGQPSFAKASSLRTATEEWAALVTKLTPHSNKPVIAELQSSRKQP
jgi:hypothetical protein